MKSWCVLGACLSLAALAVPAAAENTKAAAKEKTAAAGKKAEKAAGDVGTLANNAATTAKIKSAMIADKTVPASTINVNTQAGVVTLLGHVETAQQKAKAEQIAKKTAGVKKVVNKLAVGAGKKPAAKH